MMPKTSFIYYGPMKSGKSKVLIEWANRLQTQGLSFLAVKPQTDTRDGAWIKSRDVALQPVPATQIESACDIKRWLSFHTYTHLLIDEIFLLDSGIIAICQHLINQGMGVIAGGLDRDFRGEWFPLADYSISHCTMEDVIRLFEHPVPLTAVCQICKCPAGFTQRLIDGQPAAYDSPLILIGDQEYQSRCHHCHHVPGRQPVGAYCK